jgi:endonuclease YncB( thermonuclease family)
LLIGIGVVIPLTTDYTQAGQLKPRKLAGKQRKYKKYSQRWRRAYQARVRQRKAMAARRRALRLRQLRLAAAGRAPAVNALRKVAGTVPDNQAADLFLLVEGKIKKVHDGQTVSVESRDGQIYLVRLLGIQAPEAGQNFGARSKKTLSDLILKKDVTVILRRRDSSERYLGTVYHAGEDINLRQIEAGMAWYLGQNPYAPKGDDRQIYERAEQKARNERSGLWVSQKTMAAFGFRRP